MPHSYPLLLDIADRLIVIVGGGTVAARKAAGLVEAGARRVRVVADQFDPQMPLAVQRIVARYGVEHLSGAGLVFAATNDPAVNDEIVIDARKMGALVCRADVDEENAGDFATPAMIRSGPMLITVSTGGNPALAAKIRDMIQQSMDPRWVEMAEAMVILRPKIRGAKGMDQTRRREIFRLLASDEAMNAIHAGGQNSLYTWLAGKFPELSDIARA